MHHFRNQKRANMTDEDGNRSKPMDPVWLACTYLGVVVLVKTVVEMIFAMRLEGLSTAEAYDKSGQVDHFWIFLIWMLTVMAFSVQHGQSSSRRAWWLLVGAVIWTVFIQVIETFVLS
jgi:hypothetical protein